jgi:hypothetical protein
MLQETRIPLRDVCEHLPKRNGKAISPATIRRWAKVGVSGHRLEVSKIGGCLFTTVESLERFLERLNGSNS